MPFARNASFAFLFVAIGACTSSEDSTSNEGGGARLCACARNDAGVLEMPLDCWCGADCSNLSKFLSLICDDTKPHRPIKQQLTYEDCHLTVLTTGPSLGPLTMVFDTLTGNLVGGRSGSDVPDLACPGTDQAALYE